MKKLKSISIFLCLALMLSIIAPIAGAISPDNVTEEVLIVGSEPVENAQGVTVGGRHDVAFIRTQRNFTTFYMRPFTRPVGPNDLIGEFHTESWFEVNTRGELLGFGPWSIGTRLGPHGLDVGFSNTYRIIFLGRPVPHIAPHTGRMNVVGEFLSIFSQHWVEHVYHFHGHNGRFDFTRN
jgi:hypothetical protein